MRTIRCVPWPSRSRKQTKTVVSIYNKLCVENEIIYIIIKIRKNKKKEPFIKTMKNCVWRLDD